MSKSSTIVLFVLLCLAFAYEVVHAQQTSTTTVKVLVKNNTAGGTAVTNDEAMLELYRDGQPLGSLQTTVDANGEAVFADVPTGARVTGVVGVKHQNMRFRSSTVSLRDATKTPSVIVHVFDVSSDQTRLSVGTHHITITVSDTSLQFEEYLLLENDSDMAVTGAERDDGNKPVVIRFGLPKGFRDLATSGYLERSALVVTSEGFYDTLAVPPGQHHVSFSYRVVIDRPAVEITRQIFLTTSELTIFWEHGRGRLEGLGQPDGQLVNAEGAPIEYYQRSGLSPGDEVSFRISGFNVQQSDRSTWIILVSVFVAAIAVALLRTRSQSTPKQRKP